MDIGLRGRRALIMASSRGLGFACAAALAAEGVDVCINGQNQETLDRAASTLKRDFVFAGIEIRAIAADVTDPKARQRLLEVVGDVDILVTNVGGLPATPTDDMSDEVWTDSIHALMLPPLSTITALLPGMMRRGWGRVVNITSSAVKRPIPGLESSTVSRLGLTGYVAGRAKEAISHGVTINSILPGRFLTDRQRAAVEKLAHQTGISTAEAQQRVESSIPAHRFGRPEEIGALCAFLCSDIAQYITGQNILIDGGAYFGTL